MDLQIRRLTTQLVRRTVRACLLDRVRRASQWMHSRAQEDRRLSTSTSEEDARNSGRVSDQAASPERRDTRAEADKTTESCPKGVANSDRVWPRNKNKKSTMASRAASSRIDTNKKEDRPRQGLGELKGFGQEGQNPRQRGGTRQYVGGHVRSELGVGKQEVGKSGSWGNGWRNSWEATRAAGSGPQHLLLPAFPEPISALGLPRTNAYANQ